ncbi:MAG: YhjD/YihY/BrkB family envelope integrity protein [Lentisphaeria bacterium]|jgi:membrane protein
MERLKRMVAGGRGFGRACWRFVAVVARDYVENQCGLQASGLTYVTLMSLVPVLALMFAVSKGFNAHDRLMAAVQDKLAALPPATIHFIQKLFAAVDNANFGTLGLVGLLLIFWTAVSVLGQIEATINQIWHVAEPRPWLRRFQTYISALVLLPIFFLAATSANALLNSARVQEFLAQSLGPFYVLVKAGLGMTGLALIVAAFTLLYLFMPNTRVRPGAALVGGLVGGGVWYLTQFAYMYFQLGIFQGGGTAERALQFKIYGAFAVIPLFLAWLYVNWVIVLLGAICGYVFQNRDSLLQPGAPGMLSFAIRLRLGLVMMQEAVGRMCAGGEPWSAREFSHRHRLRFPDVMGCLRELVRAGLLVEVAGRPGAFTPARPPDLLTPADVERALREAPPGSGAPGGAKPPPAGAELGRLRSEDYAVCRLYEERFGRFAAELRQTSFRDLAGGG